MRGTGYCECGCGEKTEICPRTVRKIGWIKGQPKRFIHGHQRKDNARPFYIVDPDTGCWVWQRYVNGKGYGMMRDGSKHMRYAHRVYYERAKGPVPDGLQLDHLCRNPPCVNPDHLEPVTPVVNSRRGDRTKLTMEQVRYIRNQPMRYGLIKSLAEEFGVHTGTITMIRNQPDRYRVDDEAA